MAHVVCGLHAQTVVFLAVAGEQNSISEEEEESSVSAQEVYNEIEQAKDKTFLLGVKLNLPEDTRRGIISMRLEKDKRLLKTIDEYLKLKEFKPDWKEIAGALKEVKLDNLAEKIENVHGSIPSIIHSKIVIRVLYIRVNLEMLLYE